MSRAPSTTTQQQHIMVAAIPRRGLSRIEAAAYVGISPSKFDELVADGRMPCARHIDTRKVWDVRELDLLFDALPHHDSPVVPNSWEDA